MMIYPLIAAGGYSLFPWWKSKQKITAASDAMKGSALARVFIAAPAKAEDRWGKDSEWTICGWFELGFPITTT